MNCPNCGNEINENQKFCPECGTELNRDEKFNDTDNKSTPSTLTKKIAICGTCAIMIILTAFGVIRYNQYQKDILPITIERKHNNTEYNISYIPMKKQALINIVFKDVIIEQWQVELYEKFKNRNDLLNFQFYIVDKNNNIQPPEIKFYKANIEINKPLTIEFVVNNQHVKDFVKFKSDIAEYFDKKQGRYGVPLIFSNEKSKRETGKQLLLKEIEKEQIIQEAEQKQKEWQKNILSNCIYKTKNGVCFTTKAFKPKPVSYYDCSGGWTTHYDVRNATREFQNMGVKTCYSPEDYWVGAIKQCSDWGFRLANIYELKSLAQDVYDVMISDDSVSNLPPNGKLNNVPLQNLQIKILPAAAPEIWTIEEYNYEKAIRRVFFSNQTYIYAQSKGTHFGYAGQSVALCVYDQNGVEKEVYKDYKTDEELKQQKMESMENELL